MFPDYVEKAEIGAKRQQKFCMHYQLFEKGIGIFLSFFPFIIFLNAIYKNFSESSPELGWMLKGGERQKRVFEKEKKPHVAMRIWAALL